jgi:hypothetical protein
MFSCSTEMEAHQKKTITREVTRDENGCKKCAVKDGNRLWGLKMDGGHRKRADEAQMVK